MHEVSKCRTSLQVKVFEWPTITTKGQYINVNKGTEAVGRSNIYSRLKTIKVTSVGSTFERVRTQLKFPELFKMFKSRGTGKSRKPGSIADAFRKAEQKRQKKIEKK